MATKKKSKSVLSRSNRSKKLTKDDPDFYAKIGAIAGKNRLRERGTNYFSEIAKLSHPRAQYNGGRPKKEK